MVADGQSKAKTLALWAGAATILGATALIGYFTLQSVPESWLSLIRAFAGGAVIASLATEVFPKAFRKEKHMTGVATAIGFILALFLHSMG